MWKHICYLFQVQLYQIVDGAINYFSETEEISVPISLNTPRDEKFLYLYWYNIGPYQKYERDKIIWKRNQAYFQTVVVQQAAQAQQAPVQQSAPVYQPPQQQGIVLNNNVWWNNFVE